MKTLVIFAALLALGLAQEAEESAVKTPGSTAPLNPAAPVVVAPYTGVYNPYYYGGAQVSPYYAQGYAYPYFAPPAVPVAAPAAPKMAEDEKAAVPQTVLPIAPTAGVYPAYYPYVQTAPVAATAPVVAAPAPVAAAPAPVATYPYTYAPSYGYTAFAPSSQYHAQDEFGNLQYGYANINSAKHEQGNTYLGVTGGYQYVDANGVLQTVNYIADGLGFRVADSRLPVAPKVPDVPAVELPKAPIFDGQPPAPVEDTPEVAAARAEFLKTFEEIKKREKRESDPAIVYGYAGGFYPFSYGAGYGYSPAATRLTYALAPYPYLSGYAPRAFFYSY